MSLLCISTNFQVLAAPKAGRNIKRSKNGWKNCFDQLLGAHCTQKLVELHNIHANIVTESLVVRENKIVFLWPFQPNITNLIIFWFRHFMGALYRLWIPTMISWGFKGRGIWTSPHCWFDFGRHLLSIHGDQEYQSCNGWDVVHERDH